MWFTEPLDIAEAIDVACNRLRYDEATVAQVAAKNDDQGGELREAL